MIFLTTKIFSFMRLHLLIVDLIACANGVLLRKSFPVQINLKVLLSFFSVSFIVSYLMLRSILSWFLCRVINKILDSFSYSCLVWSGPFVKFCSFSSVHFCLLYQKKKPFFHRTVDLCLCFHLHSIDQYVCFYDVCMVFLFSSHTGSSH